jgi:phosphatidylinositol 4-kinase
VFFSRVVGVGCGRNVNDAELECSLECLFWDCPLIPPPIPPRKIARPKQFSGSRQVFDGIEFYLPQIAHMIIHLEADWDEAILERFALVIAQQSQHFALQLTWILQGAVEDYQPETSEGRPNPGYNKLFYHRCITLLSNIERCVVYGSPRSIELHRMYERGEITHAEYEQMKLEDRLNNARQITTHGANFRKMVQRVKESVKESVIDSVKLPTLKTPTKAAHEADMKSSTTTVVQTTMDTAGKQISKYGGYLLYKRRVRTACYKRKTWKSRYFEIEERMLYCYNKRPTIGGRLIRAMPLEGAVVKEKTGEKYPFLFEAQNHHFEFVMRAKNFPEMQLWMKLLTGESEANALIPHIISNDEVDDNVAGNEEKKDDKGSPAKTVPALNKLTPCQQARYDFFKNERDFVSSVCEVAEVLRFHEPKERKALAPGLVSAVAIPSCAYVPLCKSTDVWRRVDSVMAADTRVFNTNERCPMIYYFVAKRGERIGTMLGPKNPNLDVAEYLHMQFQVPDTIPVGRLSAIGEDSDHESLNVNDTYEEVEEAKEEIIEVGKREPDEKTNDGAEKEDGEAGQEVCENGIHEEDDDNDTLGSVDPTDSPADSARAAVWSDDSRLKSSFLGRMSNRSSGPSSHKGNEQLRRFLDENVVKLPSRLSMQLNRFENRRKSYLERAAGSSAWAASIPEVNAVSNPIIERDSDDDDSSCLDSLSLDGQSVVSEIGGSIILGDQVVAFQRADGVDKASLDRAKEVICGGESWVEKSARMLRSAKSVNKDEDEDGTAIYEIVSFMAKSNDDLRQEVFVMQMIHYFESVFRKSHLPIWLKTYRILSTSKRTGLIEVLIDATSIDGLKKSEKYPENGGMRAYFEQVYGPPTSKAFLAAQRNFVQSLAGYSLVSYLLGLKDRHNGNIMIDTRGHIIHIDFGFAFGMAPGHEWSFERAPFKLTKDYIDVMGGTTSECFKEFQKLFVDGFKAARNHSLSALGLVEIMMYKSNYPCFSGTRYGGGVSLKRFEKRLMLDIPDGKVEKRAMQLINDSIDSYGTKIYDVFQHHSNGLAV